MELYTSTPSLQKNIRLSLVAASFALIGLTLVDLYSTQTLYQGQEALLNELLPLERAGEGINRNFAQLLERQSIFLRAENIEKLNSLPSRTPIESSINTLLNTLEENSKKIPDGDKRFIKLKKNYESIISLDQELYEQTKALLSLNAQQSIANESLDELLTKNEIATDQLDATEEASIDQLEKDLSTAVNDPELLSSKERLAYYSQLLKTVSTDPEYKIRKYTERLQQQIARLAIITRQFLVTQEPKNLKELEKNSLKPIFAGVLVKLCQI
jgi:hypothetical protein